MQNAYSQTKEILPASFDAIGIKATAVSSHQYANRAQIFYQKTIKGNNRLEFDLGYHSGETYSEKQNGYRVAAVYHRVMPIVWTTKNFVTDGTHKSFNRFYWYYGGGLGVGNYNYEDFTYESYNKDGIFVQLPVELGIEYLFDKVPMCLSLDMAYDIGLNYIEQDMGLRMGLGIKYIFNVRELGVIKY